MLCSKCNTRNNYYHNYCYHCGAKFNTRELQLATEGQVRFADGVLLNKSRETCNPYKDRKKVKKRLLYSAAFFVVVLAGSIWWFLLR